SIVLADQLRGYYNCQLIVRSTNTNITSKDFRITLVWDLFQEALDNKNNGNKR
ncbi:16567_t:CDS:2, partial [Dentiscutata heterogama]